MDIYTICRICLATNIKMYDMMKYNLNVKYEKLTGHKITSNDKLPQSLCWECVARLRSGNELRHKASKSLQILLDKENRSITATDIKQLHECQFIQKSSLGTFISKPNPFDRHIFEFNDEHIEVSETDLDTQDEGIPSVSGNCSKKWLVNDAGVTLNSGEPSADKGMVSRDSDIVQKITAIVKGVNRRDNNKAIIISNEEIYPARREVADSPELTDDDEDTDLGLIYDTEEISTNTINTSLINPSTIEYNNETETNKVNTEVGNINANIKINNNNVGSDRKRKSDTIMKYSCVKLRKEEKLIARDFSDSNTSTNAREFEDSDEVDDTYDEITAYNTKMNSATNQMKKNETRKPKNEETPREHQQEMKSNNETETNKVNTQVGNINANIEMNNNNVGSDRKRKSDTIMKYSCVKLRKEEKLIARDFSDSNTSTNAREFEDSDEVDDTYDEITAYNTKMNSATNQMKKNETRKPKNEETPREHQQEMKSNNETETNKVNTEVGNINGYIKIYNNNVCCDRKRKSDIIMKYSCEKLRMDVKVIVPDFRKNLATNQIKKNETRNPKNEETPREHQQEMKNNNETETNKVNTEVGNINAYIKINNNNVCCDRKRKSDIIMNYSCEKLRMDVKVIVPDFRKHKTLN